LEFNDLFYLKVQFLPRKIKVQYRYLLLLLLTCNLMYMHEYT